MTDDIVARLRKAHVSGMKWIKAQGQHPTTTIHAQAANEIERLRRILRHVASNNPALADPEIECRTCNDIIKEFGR